MSRAIFLESIRKPSIRTSIVIPEFGGIKAFFTPMTPGDEIEMKSMLEGMDIPKNGEAVYQGIAILAQKLEDEDGNKLIQAGDFPDLLRIKSSVVGRIVNEINLAESNWNQMVEDEKKPSAETESE